MTSTVVRVAVLDLDDTLYLERDYVISGFRAVDEHVRQTHGVHGFFNAASSLFESGHRSTVFDHVLPQLGLDATAELIQELVRVYRFHRPAISMCPDAVEFLEWTRNLDGRALITDGPIESQQAKIDALSIAKWFALIVITDAWGSEFRKPHERAFVEIEHFWPSVSPAEFVYIADNPKKDFVTPRARGWQTARVVREHGEHRGSPMIGSGSADETVQHLTELTMFRRDRRL